MADTRCTLRRSTTARQALRSLAYKQYLHEEHQAANSLSEELDELSLDDLSFDDL